MLITTCFVIFKLRNMLEDIEEGELDYGDEDDGELNDDDDLPDLPEYDPIAKDNVKDEEGEEGEILSDNEVSACALIKNSTYSTFGGISVSYYPIGLLRVRKELCICSFYSIYTIILLKKIVFFYYRC